MNKKILFLMILAAAGVFVESQATGHTREAGRKVTQRRKASMLYEQLRSATIYDKESLMKRLINVASIEFLKEKARGIGRQIQLLADKIRHEKIRLLKNSFLGAVHIALVRLKTSRVGKELKIKRIISDMKRRINDSDSVKEADRLSENIVRLTYKIEHKIPKLHRTYADILLTLYDNEIKFIEKYREKKLAAKDPFEKRIYESFIETVSRRVANQFVGHFTTQVSDPVLSKLGIRIYYKKQIKRGGRP
jgi:hypothetical protein